MEEIEFMRCALIGAPRAGKSSVLFLLQNNGQTLQQYLDYDSFIEDSIRKEMTVDDEKSILECQEVHHPPNDPADRPMNDRAISQANGFLLLFGIISRETFEVLPSALDTIKRIQDKDTVPCVVVGTKREHSGEERQVSMEEAQSFARSIGCPYFEVSVSSHSDAFQAYDQIVREIRKAKAIPSSSSSPSGPKAKKDCTVM